MAVLVWKHGKSQSEAIAAIKTALKESGIERLVKWTGPSAETKVGPGASIAHAAGEVRDDAIVIEKCAGLASGVVLVRCREFLAQLFPNGG